MKVKLLLLALLSLLLLRPSAGVAAPAAVVNTATSSLEREVRHELLMLPYYTVFDHLAFEIRKGSTVVLMGEVTRPVLKDDAERVVKRLEGVERVDNQIHVLPLSPFDDQTRVAAFRAIYGSPELNRYVHQAIPPIHIIVENGNITLEGVVANESDRELAYMKALGVPGTFSVTNHLRVES